MSSGGIGKHIQDLKHIINIKLSLPELPHRLKVKMIKQDLNALIFYYAKAESAFEKSEIKWFLSIILSTKSLRLWIKICYLFWQRR